VVADITNAIDSDPPEGNTYDLVGHVQTSAALMDTNKRLDLIEVSNLPRLGVANNHVSV